MISSSRLKANRIILAWLLSGACAFAQLPALEVRSPSAKLIEVNPGRMFTASVVVANRGSEADELVETFILPPGCQRVMPPEAPFRLEPGAQIVRVLVVLVPPNTPAGPFALGYRVQGRRDPSVIGSFDFSVQVTPIDNLELVVEPRPDMVLAGDSYTVKLRVTNRGNSRITARLTQRSSLVVQPTVDATAFALEAGATREIECRVQTERGLAKQTTNAVTFDVTATSATGKVLAASQASVAQIIPLVSGNRDSFHYFPFQLRTIFLAELGHPGQMQSELSGSGSLDEAGEHRIDFILRGPDAQSSSLFGERDEYGASFHGEDWDVDVGDRVYALSPLTERHSLGRGGGVKWHDTNTSAGAFYMTTRYRRQNTEELGAFVRHDFTETFSLQGNFLRKTSADQLPGAMLPENIITLESRHRVGKLLDLRLEGGLSRSDAGTMDFAYRAEARGELPGMINYAVEQAHAGPNFYGQYNDTDTTYATVTKAITAKLHLNASLSRYENNLGQNDIRSPIVTRENSWNVGLNYALAKPTELFVEEHHVDRTDILLPAAFDFSEDFARVGASHNFGQIHLRGDLDVGMLDNSLTGEDGTFQRYSVTANWQATPRQMYSFFASYGPSAFTGSTAEALSAGVSGQWRVQDDFTANLSYARNQYDGLLGREQDQVLASLRYQFQNKSSISVIGRLSRATTKGTAQDPINEAAIMVAYSVPLSRPVSRKRSIGALQGRLFEATLGREVGLSRVVVQVAEQFAVTDGEGFFEFPALKPGKCELRIMTDSLGVRMTMATLMPMQLKILPAETSHVRLEVTPACSIAVNVIRFAFASGKALTNSEKLQPVGGEEAVTVEITNGRDIWRAQTDRTGNVAFDRLPGGPWKLRVAASSLPVHHTIENPERIITIKAGESQQVTIRVVPLRRTIRLLDRGTVR